MPDRRAEEGHDAVAHDLVDGSFVVMDGLHHPLEHGIQELPGFFGITVGEELHGALEVGEEHRHLLALAFQRALRGEDSLGEVLGGVGLRRPETRFGGLGERCRALSAELVARWVGRAARWADRRKRRRTLATEFHASEVLGIAVGAPHRSAPP
jgi:hypothetical protein